MPIFTVIVLMTTNMLAVKCFSTVGLCFWHPRSAEQTASKSFRRHLIHFSETTVLAGCHSKKCHIIICEKVELGSTFVAFSPVSSANSALTNQILQCSVAFLLEESLYFNINWSYLVVFLIQYLLFLFLS